MEAGVRELREHLSRYLDAVRAGDEVTVTAARIPKRPRSEPGLITVGTVSDLVADQRQ